jgi:hypothetical protein
MACRHVRVYESRDIRRLPGRCRHDTHAGDSTEYTPGTLPGFGTTSNHIFRRLAYKGAHFSRKCFRRLLRWHSIRSGLRRSLRSRTSYPPVWRELRAGCDRLVTVSRLFSSLAIPFPSSRTHELLYLLGVSTLPLPLFMTSAV